MAARSVLSWDFQTSARWKPAPDPVPLDFHARSENFNDATPTMVWDLLLRALGLRTVLAEEGTNPGFREEATKNLRRFIQELME